MATTARTVWLNGELRDVEAATVGFAAHAVQRGSLVFDVGHFGRTHSKFGEPDGRVALFRPRDHVARFLASARVIGLAVTFDAKTLEDAAVAVVRACGKDAGLVRWSAYFASPEPDLVPRSAAAHVVVAAQFLQDPPSRSALRIVTYNDARKASRDALPPEAKVAAAYTGPMLARMRAQADGFDDVVLLDADGFVAEAPIANVFAVVQGELLTPPLGQILPGITRQTVVALAHDEQLVVRETLLSPESFAAADEAFLTSTPLPLRAIGSIGSRSLPTSTPVTTRLAARLDAARNGRDSAHADWLRWI